MKSTNALHWLFMSFILLPMTGADGLAAGRSPEGPLAIRGYDTVAYFRDGKAAKGNPSFTFQWQALTWHFTTQKNRDLFAAHPERYAPQYDGYCAWAMVEGRKAETDPEVWKIVDGKLYLNCSQAAYEKWSRDIPGHIEKADAQWRKFFEVGR